MSSLRWLTFLALASAIGCSRSTGPICYSVYGQVLYQDRPLAEALVVFHPLDAAADFPRPLATTDQQGRFELTTIQSRDGAPAGKYAITVEHRQSRLVGEEMVRDGRNQLPPRFSKPDTTPLTYTVAAGPNEVPPLKIPRQ